MRRIWILPLPLVIWILLNYFLLGHSLLYPLFVFLDVPGPTPASSVMSLEELKGFLPSIFYHPIFFIFPIGLLLKIYKKDYSPVTISLICHSLFFVIAATVQYAILRQVSYYFRYLVPLIPLMSIMVAEVFEKLKIKKILKIPILTSVSIILIGVLIVEINLMQKDPKINDEKLAEQEEIAIKKASTWLNGYLKANKIYNVFYSGDLTTNKIMRRLKVYLSRGITLYPVKDFNEVFDSVTFNLLDNKFSDPVYSGVVLILDPIREKGLISHDGINILKEFPIASIYFYIKRKDSYRIMCLGDSFTASGGEDSYPDLLQKILDTKGKDLGMELEVINKGVAGGNTASIVSRFIYNLDKYRPDLVITMMGINDEIKILPFEDNGGILSKGLVVFSKNKHKSSIEDVRSFSNKDIDYIVLAQKKIEQGRYEIAEKILTKLIEIDPEDQMAHVILARCYRFKRMYDPGRNMIKKVIKMNPRNDKAYVELGRVYRTTGRYLEAKQMFEKAIEMNPFNPEAYIELVWWYREQGVSYKTVELLQKVIEIDPENYSAYAELGTFLRYSKNSHSVEAIFKKIIEDNPRNEVAYIILGWYYEDRAEYTKAKEMFEKAIEISPDNYRSYIGLGGIYRKEDAFIKSQENFEKAMAKVPRNDWTLSGLGFWYLDRGENWMAEEMFKKAIEINPRNDGAHTGLGLCYRLKVEYDKAIDILKGAVEINPRNDMAFFELGQCYEGKKDYGIAKEMFKRSIEINASARSYRAYIGLARCHGIEGEYIKSIEILKKAIKIDRRMDIAFVVAGECYYRLKRHRSAERYFAKADNLKLRYYNPMTYHHYHRLKDILEKRGIGLACVQYPLRNIKPLKKMFSDKKGIIYIDNEDSFRTAVEKSDYDEYFTGVVTGESHCTTKGNVLLAEKIADAILQKYLKKK